MSHIEKLWLSFIGEKYGHLSQKGCLTVTEKSSVVTDRLCHCGHLSWGESSQEESPQLSVVEEK